MIPQKTSDVRLEPITRKPSKPFKDQGRRSSKLNENVNYQFQSLANERKSSRKEKQELMQHAPESLQPLRLSKSRNEIHLEDQFNTDLKLNPLSPDPLRPIPILKSRMDHETTENKYHESSFKEGFLL